MPAPSQILENHVVADPYVLEKLKMSIPMCSNYGGARLAQRRGAG